MESSASLINVLFGTRYGIYILNLCYSYNVFTFRDIIHANMPLTTENTFKGIPTFPNTVPTAPLLRISLAKLLAGDAEEQDRVWQACQDLGFFYLDMRTDNDAHDLGLLKGNAILDDADQLFKTGEGFFDLPVEEKQQYDFSERNSYFG